MKIIIFFVMNAFLIKENRDFPLIKDYHSNLQSSLSLFIFFPSFCYIWSSCNKEKNKPPFLMQKMSLKLRVKTGNCCDFLITSVIITRKMVPIMGRASS